ncbi:tetratricopeptide repeat protein [Mesorhizobium sp. M0058]|uniref:tetratricopeptide repeat protein n=1 Tax=Mesorhizobium sp. M0058 TaxID=2956865 RepID=UPI00333BA7D9
MGRYFHRKGLFEEALTHYDAVVFTERELGKNATVTGWRLNALFNLGEIRAAFRAINQLLADADRETWIWPWCARQVAAFGRTSVEAARGALGFWQRYVQAHREVESARVNLLLTQFYLRQEGADIGKDYAAFRVEFDDNVAYVEPEQAALVWDRLGHWAQDEDNWTEAERCFRIAYETDGGHYGYCLGAALNFLGRYEEALPLVLAQAQGIQPDAMSWFQVAVANEHLGRTKAAVDAYRLALVLNPDYSLAMFNMAGTLWNSGDREHAAIVFLTAARQFPDHDLTAQLRGDFPELF